MALHMLVICYDPSAPRDEGPSRQPEHAALTQEMRANGHHVSGGGLAPLALYGKRVRRKDGKPVVIDGPFAETKEAIGGYFLVDCEEDEALAYAGRIPVDARSWVEVRRMFVYKER
jgi:hypothetical protein